MLDNETHFERNKAHFFMHDLYPENVHRFDPRFSDETFGIVG